MLNLNVPSSPSDPAKAYDAAIACAKALVDPFQLTGAPYSLDQKMRDRLYDLGYRASDQHAPNTFYALAVKAGAAVHKDVNDVNRALNAELKRQKTRNWAKEAGYVADTVERCFRAHPPEQQIVDLSGLTDTRYNQLTLCWAVLKRDDAHDAALAARIHKAAEAEAKKLGYSPPKLKDDLNNDWGYDEEFEYDVGTGPAITACRTLVGG